MSKRGRPKCFDSDTVLEAAMMLFWERGFEQTSVDELAGAMELSTSSVYCSFGDKESLFLAAVNHYLSGRGHVFDEAVLGGKTAREGFARLMKTAATELTRADQPRGCMLWLAVPTCSPKYENLQTEMNRLRDQSESVWISRLEEAVQSRELPGSTDIALLASYFRTTLAGMSLQSRSGATAEQLMQVGKLAMKVWPVPARSNSRAQSPSQKKARLQSLHL